MATYNSQNPATYNAQNPATYNASNPATYNAPVAGGTSGALGVVASGAPAGNSPTSGSFVSATTVSYNTYPDYNTYPVTVDPNGGQVTVVSS